MKRNWIIAGALFAGVTALAGLAYAASDDNGSWHRGPAHMRGEGPRGGGMHGMHGQMGPEMGRHGSMRGGGMHGVPHGRSGGLAAVDPGKFDELKKQLAITEQQEAAWTRYTKAVNDAAEAAKARHEGVDHDAMHKMSSQDRRAFHDNVRELRSKEIDAVSEAADELFKVLDEKQRIAAGRILPVIDSGSGMHNTEMHGHGMGHSSHR